MSERADVLVVGGGITGLSAAWRLSAAGRHVVLLEQFRIGHPHGSSHGAVRIFRFAYPDPYWVRLAQASLPRWRELEASPEEIVRITGGIDVGEAAFVDPIADALRSCGAAVEELTPARRTDRYPWLEAGDVPAVYSPDTGVIDAERALARAADAARSLGADIREDTKVERIETAAAEVIVHTGDGSLRAATVVVSAGAWAGELLRMLGITVPLRVTRELVMYFAAPPGRTLPPLPFIHYGGITRYGVPAAGSAPGYKIGEHGSGPEAVPGIAAPEPPEPGAARLRAYVSAALLDLTPAEVGWETCLYTSTPSQDFVIDARDRVVVASPCSGHGFKFGPLTGEIIAATATGRPAPARFALAAFS